MDRDVQCWGVTQEADVLPFNKRRNNSEIEIQTDEVEPIQLPPVRPPSVRPAAGAASRYSSRTPLPPAPPRP